MAQKTLINGTAYEISGGSVLKDGTKYQIGGGKTLVGGTGYDIVISRPIIITVTGGSTQTGNRARAYVRYNGEEYASGSFEVQPGETLRVVLESTSNKEKQQITLNGVVVASYGDHEKDYYDVVYDYAPTKSATITITMHGTGGGAFARPTWSTAAIVEAG